MQENNVYLLLNLIGIHPIVRSRQMLVIGINRSQGKRPNSLRFTHIQSINKFCIIIQNSFIKSTKFDMQIHIQNRYISNNYKIKFFKIKQRKYNSRIIWYN